jgi:L-rhamnose mutarotase
MQRYCFALDLIDSTELIHDYELHHKNVWPEILTSLKEAGIRELEIYRTGNRLFMIMDTDDEFSLEAKTASDNQNPKVQEWESLMWKYQQALPNAKPGEKWVLMDKLFKLDT